MERLGNLHKIPLAESSLESSALRNMLWQFRHTEPIEVSKQPIHRYLLLTWRHYRFYPMRKHPPFHPAFSIHAIPLGDNFTRFPSKRSQ